jgi:uncharacterized membrane protein YfcA
MSAVRILLGTLAATAVLLAICSTMQARRQMRSVVAVRERRAKRIALVALVGLVTNFFDTLGIGSFATTTSAFRLFRLVSDEFIPGTLIVGQAIPVVIQALLFISAIPVDSGQLAMLVGACVAGGWVGAGIVASLSRRMLQFGMGAALLAAALFMLLGMFGLFPSGGTALALRPSPLAFAIAINFLLGALLTLGIGNYAPSLILFSLLGMDPRAAFPIMMGSGAFVATVAGVRFVNTGRLDRDAALGLTAGGVPGVVVAVWLVKSLPLVLLRELVVVVVLCTSAMLFRSAARAEPEPLLMELPGP